MGILICSTYNRRSYNDHWSLSSVCAEKSLTQIFCKCVSIGVGFDQVVLVLNNELLVLWLNVLHNLLSVDFLWSDHLWNCSSFFHRINIVAIHISCAHMDKYFEIWTHFSEFLHSKSASYIDLDSLVKLEVEINRSCTVNHNLNL